MLLTVNGHEVYAATGGAPFDPDRPCVVLIHGAGMDHTVWALQVRYFSHNGWTALALDMPGHGRSGGQALDTIDALGDWVAGVLDAAGFQKATVIGHSMGALTALSAASRHPDRVEKLALLGANAAMPVNQALLDAAKSDQAAAVRFIVTWGYGRRAHLGGMRAPGLWMTGGGTRLLERCPDGVLYTDFNACNAYQDGLTAAAKVTAPTLVLCGGTDRMTPAKGAKKLADGISDARLEVLKDAGHMMMLEQPDATLDALQAFMRQ